MHALFEGLAAVISDNNSHSLLNPAAAFSWLLKFLNWNHPIVDLSHPLQGASDILLITLEEGGTVSLPLKLLLHSRKLCLTLRKDISCLLSLTMNRFAFGNKAWDPWTWDPMPVSSLILYCWECKLIQHGRRAYVSGALAKITKDY